MTRSGKTVHFLKFFKKNAVGAPKVTPAKKLIPKIILGQEMESPRICEQIHLNVQHSYYLQLSMFMIILVMCSVSTAIASELANL